MEVGGRTIIKGEKTRDATRARVLGRKGEPRRVSWVDGSFNVLPAVGRRQGAGGQTPERRSFLPRFFLASSSRVFPFDESIAATRGWKTRAVLTHGSDGCSPCMQTTWKDRVVGSYFLNFWRLSKMNYRVDCITAFRIYCLFNEREDCRRDHFCSNATMLF